MGILTFFPTFPGLMSHHCPCLTSWDGPSLDQTGLCSQEEKSMSAGRVFSLGLGQGAAQPGMAAATAQRTGGRGGRCSWAAGNLGSQRSSLLATSRACPLHSLLNQEGKRKRGFMPAILTLRMKKWVSQKPRLHPYPVSVLNLILNTTTATYPWPLGAWVTLPLTQCSCALI